MSDSPTFTDLLDDAAFLSLEHQVHLEEVLGHHSWRVNMQTGIFAFDTEHGTLECTDFHLLGTAAPNPGSWLWSWANPSGFPPAVSALAETVREFGLGHGIGELSSAELPFEALPLDRPEPHQVAGLQTEAAKAVTGRWSHYQGPVGDNGTRAAFLVEHPDFRLPPPDGPRIMRILGDGLAGLRLHDHRRAIGTYLRYRGLNSVFSPDYRELTVDAPVLSGTIGFDELGRAASIEMTVSAA